MNSNAIKRLVAVAGLVLCLALINWKIVEKEDHLATGQVVYLRLAPVDPRSLMQGDFMALRYALGTDISRELRKLKSTETENSPALDNNDGLAHVALDEKKVASLIAIELDDVQSGSVPPSAIGMQFRVRDKRVKFGTNAYFFQEGTGQQYTAARYGKFRVSKNGELLLTDLADAKFQILGTAD